MNSQRFNEAFEYRSGQLIWKISGQKIRAGMPAGTMNSSGYRIVMLDGKRYQAHRVIFMMHHGYLPEFVDHINGIKTDNRIENLRAATREQNRHNSRSQSNSAHGRKGVSWHKASQKWTAKIGVGGKRHHLGLFNSIEEAAAAYATKAAELHGQFARA